MENKFTKGKWHVEHHHESDNCYYISSEKDIVITTAWQGRAFKDEAEYNAKLIAAAPELLEALISVLNIMNKSKRDKRYHLNGDIASWGEFEEIKQAEQAIKKEKK